MLLIEEGDLESMSDLLNRGTDINAQNKSGQTALGIAAKNGITPAVAILLEYGADVNTKNKVHILFIIYMLIFYYYNLIVWPNSLVYCLLTKL